MSEENSKPATPSASSGAQPVADYLSNVSYLPAVLGGLAGAGAGAFTTASKEGEKPRDRFRRQLRNALLGGAVGAGGGQLAFMGTDLMTKALNNKDHAGRVHQGDPGFLSSLLMRGLYGTGGALAVGGATRRINRSAFERLHLLANAVGGKVDKSFEGVGRTERGIDKAKSLNDLFGGMSREQVLDWLRKHWTTVRDPYLDTKKKMTDLANQARSLRAAEKLKPSMEPAELEGRLKGIKEELQQISKRELNGGKGIRAQRSQAYDRYLNQALRGAGLTGGGRLGALGRVLDPLGHHSNRGKRIAGRGLVGTAGITGAFMPEILNLLSPAVSEGIQDTMTSSIPGSGSDASQGGALETLLKGRKAF